MASYEIPEHVVYREFATETVILNMETGQYHGLNDTAVAMLKAVTEGGSSDAALDDLASAYGVPRDQIARDLDGLCQTLLARGLLAERAPDG